MEEIRAQKPQGGGRIVAKLKDGKELRFSHSFLTNFRNCRRKAHLALKYVPKKVDNKLHEGRFFHDCLEKMYSGEWHLEQVDADYLANEAKNLAQGDTVLEGKLLISGVVAAWYAKAVLPRDIQNFEIVGNEEPFEFEILPGVKWYARVDRVFRHRKSGMTFMVENKYTAMENKIPQLDFQISMNTLAMVPKYGQIMTIYDEIAKPRITSKKTLAELLVQGCEIISNVLNEPLDYGTGLMFDHKRVKRSMYSRSQEELQVALADTRDTIQEFMDGFKDIRNPTGECVWKCAFLKLCVTEDPIVIKAFYDPADGRFSVQEEEQEVFEV